MASYFQFTNIAINFCLLLGMALVGTNLSVGRCEMVGKTLLTIFRICADIEAEQGGTDLSERSNFHDHLLLYGLRIRYVLAHSRGSVFTCGCVLNVTGVAGRCAAIYIFG